MDPEPWPDIAELNEMLDTRRKGKRIFVCSTFDIFHPITKTLIVPTPGKSISVRDAIFDVIERRPDNTFIVLTKLPQNIDRPMPPNVWLGVSMTGPADTWRWTELKKHTASVRFISAEPLLEPHTLFLPFPDWLILGRLTGHGKKDDPSLDMLHWIYADCKQEKVPLFMKSNLAGIWPGELIQEFPLGGSHVLL
jgi:protein gp37